MKQTPEARRKSRESNKPCGLISRICVSAIMLFIGTMVPFKVFSADLNNPEIQRLISEKQQKIAALEKCSRKVKGFKIAGISTIGLTTVGTIGNIALSNKREDVSNQLQTANQTLAAQQAAERAAAEEARKKAECEKNPDKEWTVEGCKDKVTTPPVTTPNNNNSSSNETATDETNVASETPEPEIIVEGRIVGGACIADDLPYKASSGSYIKLARAFTVDKNGWASKRCWSDANKTTAVDCSCAATACSDSDTYEVKQGQCIKKTVSKEEKPVGGTETTTTTTITLDASKDGVGYSYKEISGDEDYVGTYNNCPSVWYGEWCTQFDEYVVKGTSTCVTDYSNEKYKQKASNQDLSAGKGSGKYCYCKMTSWTPNGGTKQSPASSWVFRSDYSDAASCADHCVLGCALNVLNHSDFRGALFGSVAN